MSKHRLPEPQSLQAHQLPSAKAPIHTKDVSHMLHAPSGPTHLGISVAPIRMQATPSWSDLRPPPLRARCSNVRWVIWSTVVIALVAAAIGLSVTMVVIHEHKNGGDSGGGSSGHGGGGSSGGGGSGNPSQPGELGTPPFAVPAGWTGIWWDEFSGSSLDTNKWNYDIGTGTWGWGNNELQKYTSSSDNVKVTNGSLAITALRTSGGGYTSGRLNTLGIASFYPGMTAGSRTYSVVHIEARIKIPAPGLGLWPAFWMFPVSLSYGKWAGSGEIDIMESINGMVELTTALQYGRPAPMNIQTVTQTRQPGNVPWSNDFHTYGVDWAQDNIIWYVDGKQVLQVWSRAVDPANGWWTNATNAGPNSPFDAPFYIIMNLAVGGLFPAASPDASTPFPAQMLVDYVRVWGR